MKLLAAIINRSDVKSVTSAMSKGGYASTVIDSFGGFYNRENAVILASISNNKIQKVMDIIRQNTHSVVEDVPTDVEFGDYKLPSQVKVGGAIVLILNVDQFAKL